MNHTFSNDMKRALGRKLNPVPRRQDIIYDLNGRPVYIGNSTADQSSPRIKSKLANQGDMLAYHAASNMHPLMEQDVSNQTLLSQIQNKKNIKAMNLRTDFSIAPISHGKRKASVQVPKLNHFNVIKNISPRRLDPENSARMDEKTKASLQMSAHVTDLSSITVPDLNPKSERPIAASEKQHIFNPRSKKRSEFQVDASGEDDASIERLNLNQSSQPDITEDQIHLKKVVIKKAKKVQSRKLSPIVQSNTNSMQGPFKKNLSTVKKDELNQDSFLMEDSIMEQSQVSQRMHVWRANDNSQSPRGFNGAVDSLYKGNSKNDHFTSTYSNVWQNTSQLMFHDSHLGSDAKRQDRQEKSYLFHLERAQKKEQKKQDEEAKDALIDHYYQQYGVMPSPQQKFFMDPIRLRELLTKKAIEKTQDNAARKIQNWWTCKQNKKKFLIRLKVTIKSII